MQVRSEYSDDGIFPPLSSEEVEQVVNVLGVSGSVYTYVLPGGEGIPVLPDFMTEDRNQGSATTSNMVLGRAVVLCGV